jgi:DNA-binding CsgD family transcriptional regulator/tetratricopeptide (TPR) repeat protein
MQATAVGHQTSLLGRATECEVLGGLLEEARADRSAVLVIRGEAGVGKTAVLDHCARQATGFRLARIAGVESEMELPFAALHQLCAPLLGRLDALAVPQQTALRVAFGLSSGDAPNRFMVGLAALSLLAEVAVERPLLCLVDDAQWLDAASSQVLGFVTRRLLAEAVVIVLVVRERPDQREFAGLPELAIDGLAEADARALLATAVPGRLDAGVRDTLIAETRGNPLALLELAQGSPTRQRPGGFGAVPARQLSERIETRFVQRLAGLSEDARRLLLVAAADPLGDPVLLFRAVERLGLAPTPASDDMHGLLAIGERVTFHHPLVRSVVYRTASPHDRRAVHLTLAEVTDPQVDADRRAWHLAAAAVGPDEEVASELERSADRAQARAGIAAAAAFLRRSVELTRDPARRIERALAAAQASLHAGTFDAALEALSTAEVGALDELQGARVQLLRGQIALASGSAADAAPLLLEAGRRLAPLDPALARETYLSACGAAMFAGPAGADDLLQVGRIVTALPPSAGDLRALDVLLDGLALLITEGRRAAAPSLLQATGAFASDRVPVKESLRWAWMATAASNALWDDDGLRAVCRRQIEVAREAGALEQLPIYLIALATATARSGDFAAASSLVAEADAVIEATGTRLAPFAAKLLLASLRGSEADASAAKRATIEQAASSQQGIAATVADWTTAILYNGLGRYEEALVAARRASSAASDQFAAMWALPELIEAATHGGEAAIASDALERLVETTEAAASDFGLGIEARCRALLREGDGAEPLHREAIERLRRTRQRSELARAHLLYGESLRRAGRRRAAREQLHTAHEMFTAMEMGAFAERARRELLATGEKARRRAAETRDVLTSHEAQIARLARDGLSNPEIAARLFLSPRTVEWHLKKVFSKLGISSRQALRDALPSADPDANSVSAPMH